MDEEGGRFYGVGLMKSAYELAMERLSAHEPAPQGIGFDEKSLGGN